MEKIKVVIISDNVDYRLKVKNLVESDSISVSGYADYDDNCVLKVSGLYPDVVIFGLEEKGNYRFEIAQEIYCKLKGCTFIMLTNDVSVNTITRAMQSGIRLVFPDNITPEQIQNAIKDGVSFERKRFFDEKPIHNHCKVFSFFSGKGGVGRTTVAVNTALGLTLKGNKVLIIDADLQFGDVNLHLDLEPKDTIAELVQEKANMQIETIQSFVTIHSSGLGVLCAPKSPEYAEYVTSKHMETIISILRPYYDYIIIDMANTFNDVTLTCAENSDHIFLVCGQEISSLKNAKSCMNILESLQFKEKITIFLNKANDTSMIKIKDFESLLGVKVSHLVPEDTKNMIMCLNKGTPIISAGRTPTEVELKSFCDKIINDKI